MAKLDNKFDHLSALFFATRQTIRQRLPAGRRSDPYAWLRLETLRFISDTGAPTMQDLAHYLRVRAPSATSLIGGLVARGLVRRSAGVRDKRVTRLHLTARGERELSAHKKRSAAILKKVFSYCTARDIRELTRILSSVANNRR